MCTQDKAQLIQVCKFIEIVLKKVNQPPGNSLIFILQPPCVIVKLNLV